MFNAVINENNEVILSGRFDASQEDKAQKVFNRIQETCVVDFAKLEYISSIGLGVLLGTQKRLSKAGHCLKLKNMTDHIRDVFRYAGFDLIFEIK